MAIKNLYTPLLLFLVVLSSCKETTEGLIIEVSHFEDNAIDFASLAEKVDTIPLFTDGNFLTVSQPKRLCANDSLLFLADEMNVISKFSCVDGHIRAQALRLGHGNSEYVDINAVSLKEDRLYLLDSSSRKVLIYDLDLNYVSHINLDFVAMDFCSVDDGFLFSRLDISEEKDDRFIKTDISGKETATFIPATPLTGNIASTKSFSCQNSNTVYLHETASPDIYSYSDNRLSLAFSLIFPPYSDIGMENKTIQVKDAFLTGSHAICSFLFQQRQYYVVHRLTDKVTVSGYYDINSGLPFSPMYQLENCLLSIFHTEDLLRLENWQPVNINENAKMVLLKYHF